MFIVYIIIGIMLGICLSIVSKDKIKGNNINKRNQTAIEKLDLEGEVIKLKNKIAENCKVIDSLNERLKNSRQKLEFEKDKNEDSSDIIENYKIKNHSLAQEIEKMKLELREYEILYNTRKTEIADLKKKYENL
ncbi:hypothetical protein [Flavobacterium piscisymbiosum]|uniref:Uncharacterized protein n=1 Tax=Flavobacterium piscisymbiosum TaxID=2893753 RepID=A0ABS8ME20_9FLAO|nr:hypothetical protein [Flavobacterium sp. F-30]MCC9063603.1 hypothetical protein [Flavobacterium sp. F-30]